MDKFERRFTAEALQIRSAEGDDGKTTIMGRAVVYNAWVQIGSDSWGWMERIAPGALRDSLGDDGIYSTFNHRADNLLARVSNGTLRMTDTEKSLMVEIDPNLDTGHRSPSARLRQTPGRARNVLCVQLRRREI